MDGKNSILKTTLRWLYFIERFDVNAGKTSIPTGISRRWSVL
jgi:hypothetical protein